MTLVYGYLESPYLFDPYLAGQAQEFLSAQVEMKVMDSQTLGCQVDMRLEANDELLGTQVDMKTATMINLRSQVEMKVMSSVDLHSQVEMKVTDDKNLHFQVEMRIVDETDDAFLGMQVEQKVFSDKHLRTQVDMKPLNPTELHSQVDIRVTDKLSRAHMQVTFGKLAHYICGGYLDEIPYLTSPYLAARFCAHQFTQVEMRIVDEADDFHLRAQVDRKVFGDKDLRTQVEMKIADHLKTMGVQVIMSKSAKLNTQVTMVIYNIEQLRILYDFKSRGTPGLAGTNWTSVQAIAPGDFSPNNLNTDIVEQRTQTDGINALWQLRCDTGNPNTFVDTIAILAHNFTRSASVEVSGSDDAGFSTIKFSYVMLTELENMYYIAPTLPNIPAQYYQFTIQDSGNSDPDGLKIGTIIFGSSLISTLAEQFLNPVTFGKRHYKDVLETEGFSPVSNDRAVRRFLNLAYSALKIEGGNFRAFRDYMTTVKTDLKALIIPRPTKPSRLAVFSKLSQLPEEQHTANDDDNWYVDLTFDWDESL